VKVSASSKVNEFGFTLIEVLLAISIFAMISMASFSIFDGVLQSEKVSKEKMLRLNDVQRTWLIIERDFLQISLRSIRFEGEAPLAGFIHSDSGSFSSNNQAIAFVRQGWINPGLLIPRSDLQSVAYRVEDEVLERLHYNFVDAVVGEEPKIRKLMENVIAIQFEYFYQNKWQTDLIENEMPQAINISIETEDLGVIGRKFLVVDAIQKSSAAGQTPPSSSGQSTAAGGH
jgi:general secretion pathway protein J